MFSQVKRLCASGLMEVDLWYGNSVISVEKAHAWLLYISVYATAV
jgi:hypothetical protein